jgi:hypothetical protein
MGIGSALSELRQTKVHHLLCLVTETRGSKGKVYSGTEHGSPLREQVTCEVLRPSEEKKALAPRSGEHADHEP